MRTDCWFDGDRSDVEAIVRELNVLCHASPNEGINNALLKAMAAGRPIVTTSVGGSPELVAGGTTGTLVRPALLYTRAAVLRGCLDEPLLRTCSGAAACEDTGRRFRLDAIVQNCPALYEEVAVRHGGARLLTRRVMTGQGSRLS